MTAKTLAAQLNLTDLVSNVKEKFFNVAVLVVIIIGIWTGILYLTSAGSPERVRSAHKSLVFLIIGVFILLISYSLISIVSSFIGLPQPSPQK